MSDPLAGLVEEITPAVLDLRRALHRIPEPGFSEHATTRLLAGFLREHGVEPHLRDGATGLWADVGGSPTVGFRADIDALPISEPETNDPRSENPGWMHACGHDAHSAIGAGIAVVLSRLELAGGVRLIFQPAEEVLPGGARILTGEGLVDGLKALLAFHVDPTLEAGKVGLRSGPITASADGLTIAIRGPGGHTSRPERSVDLVALAARVVTELPPRIREAIDPTIPVVTAFGSIHGGDASNVIPTEISLRGTVRTGDREVWAALPGLVADLLAGILADTGTTHTLDYVSGVAPVVNDAEIVGIASREIARHFGADAVAPTGISMGGEDFSDYPVASALLRLGTRSGGGDIHSSTFLIDENAVGFGVAAGSAALLGLLAEY